MKLLLTTSCDKVLEDPESGTSLIAIFHEIKVHIPIDAEIPNNAAIPREWFIFTKFSLAPEEEEADYALETQVFWPDGTQFLGLTIGAKQPTRNGMAFKVKLPAFPIGQPGSLKITQTLRSNSDIVLGPIENEIIVRIERGLVQP